MIFNLPFGPCTLLANMAKVAQIVMILSSSLLLILRIFNKITYKYSVSIMTIQNALKTFFLYFLQ